MTYYSISRPLPYIAELLNGKEDDRGFFRDRTYYGDRPIWLIRDNTLYKYKRPYDVHTQKWLEKLSPKFKENDFRMYIPMARKEGDVYIGYSWERKNLAMYLLKDSTTRGQYYNLYWVDIGNHPYPKGMLFQQGWREQEYLRHCHKIVYPSDNPLDCIIFPSELDK